MRIGTLVGCVAVAGFVGAASGQLFVQSVGEPIELAEATNDLDFLTGGEISAVGAIFDPGFFSTVGYTVVHTPGGFPILSWVISDPNSFNSELLGHLIDPVDKNQIILMRGMDSGPMGPDTVVFKFEPFSGTLGYQWRYPFTGFGENLGIERDGPWSVVAAAAVNPSSGGSVPTLLKFDSASGAQLFFTRYPFFGQPVFNGRFFDVAVEPESGDIYAVGSIEIDDPERFRSGQGVLIARFNSLGFPVWFNVYEARRPSAQYSAHTGTSIELNGAGDVHVTARSVGGSLSDVFHLTVSGVNGVPIAANLFRNDPGFASIVPAFSSLERLPDGSMLASGTLRDGNGTRPVMWNVDPVFGGLNWFYAPKGNGIEGTSAVPQPGEGLLLGGRWIAPSGGLGGSEDMLLARTSFAGAGYCEDPSSLLTGDPQVAFISLQTDPESLRLPEKAGLLVERGEAVVIVECDCPADLDNSGSLNFSDVTAFLTLYGMGDLRVDFDNNGSLNFADVTAFLTLYAAGCP